MSDQPAPPTFDRGLKLIFASGLGLLAVFIVGTLAFTLFGNPPYDLTWRLVFAHLVGGRAVNVLVGVDLAFHPFFIFVQCALEDILFVLLGYPIIVAGYRHVVEWRILGPILMRVRATADRHRSKVEPFGAIGLMGFVILPFFSTGALVGSVLGYIIGMRTWLILGTVLGGNTIAIGVWVYFFDWLDQLSTVLTRNLLIGVITIIVVGAIGGQIYRMIQARRRFAYARNLGLASAEDNGAPPKP